MLIYGVIFIYFFIKILQNPKISKNSYNFLQVFMIIFLSFSYKMGIDWTEYQVFYNNIENIDILNYKGLEIGYTIYNLVMKKVFGFNYEIFMGITIGACVYILLRELKKRAINYYLAVYLYLIMFLFGFCFEPVARQLIATTLFIYSLKYIEKKNIIKYILMILIASSFHKSAVILIVVYFLDKVEIKFKTAILMLLIGIISVENLGLLLDVFSKLLPSLNKFKKYINSEIYGISKFVLKDIFIRLIKSLISLYIIYFSYDFFNKKRNYIKNLAVIYCIITALQSKFLILARIASYFTFFFVIALSSIGYLRFNQYRRVKKGSIIFLILIFFLYCMQFLIGLYNNDWSKYKYGNYKNYLVERLKGTHDEIDEEKINAYIKEGEKYRYKK